MPELTPDHVAALASASGVRILADDLNEVTHRLNALLLALAPLNRLKRFDEPLMSPPLPEGDA